MVKGIESDLTLQSNDVDIYNCKFCSRSRFKISKVYTSGCKDIKVFDNLSLNFILFWPKISCTYLSKGNH